MLTPTALVLMDEVVIDILVDIWLALVLIDEVVVDKLVDI